MTDRNDYCCYTSSNGDISGRASNFFTSKDRANKLCEKQNAKARRLGIKVRYAVIEQYGK